ncbi:MAG: hypothetical protein US30_C0010G0002 [Candidatus Moranbacteria bacterium GW2011_GWF2_36_839]|nr:MAG: hypothetical protein US27_C0010G0039 [Candidatus Moranbacteria bacterium GW2011_GWF1_36_78]KKQ16845.1 MAG: hypothetical protein US30_C0010G0002 [Candidatus Moranbacteria bacterium GW2011_GWF2_36_839]HAT74405.1 hypothetical protein [Candidatus Moranbacteria bacterium]HBY11157.1 hypothetical protein [Candidatus Moranbacteria bacterium]
MDKKNKIFFIVAFLLLFGSVGATYLRIVVFKNYTVEAQADCDPETEKCFVWECDPASAVEGEACSGDAENDIWYYQLVRRKAYNVPLCNPDEDENLPAGEAGCLPMECDSTTEKDCEIIFCDDENKIEQEVECSDPVEYLLNNPTEGEEEEEIEEEAEEEEVEGEAEGEEGEEVSPEDEADASASEDEKNTIDGEETENKDEETKSQEAIN